MKRKKKGASLPRVTVLAYNRRDLLAFVEAVEKLRLLVDDLHIAANTITKKKAKLPPVSSAANVESVK